MPEKGYLVGYGFVGFQSDGSRISYPTEEEYYESMKEESNEEDNR